MPITPIGIKEQNALLILLPICLGMCYLKRTFFFAVLITCGYSAIEKISFTTLSRMVLDVYTLVSVILMASAVL